MPHTDQNPINLSEFEDAAKRSQEAGIADETAAYDLAIDKDGDNTLEDGNTATDSTDVTASGAE